jgi:uncharacterized protein involved in exopolysaccharide biosynthesis
LFRVWKLVLALSGIVVSAMGAWIYMTPTSYESEMTFLVKNDRADTAARADRGGQSSWSAPANWRSTAALARFQTFGAVAAV